MAGEGAGGLKPAGGGETVRLPGGIEISIRVTGADTDGALALFEETTQPNGGPPLHVHERQTEVFRVLEGRYVFALGDERVEGGPGDVVVVPPGTPHAFRNVTDAPARLSFLLAPALNADETFRIMPALLEGYPPDMAKVNEGMAPHGLKFVGPPLAVLDGG